MIERSNPFIVCPDCIYSRAKLKGILCDYFLDEKLKVNVILAAFDEGIVDAIKEAEHLDNILAVRFIKALVTNYGITEENAHFAAKYWFDEFGEGVLRKSNKLGSDLHKPIPTKKQSQTKPNTVPAIIPTSGVVSVKSIQEKEKLSKDILQRNIVVEQQYGITDFRCTIIKNYVYDRYCNFKITGEYTGKVSQYLLLVFMAYNANDELIEADFEYKITDNFKGHKAFAISLQLPNDEYLSKIIMRIVPDPVFA